MLPPWLKYICSLHAAEGGKKDGAAGDRNGLDPGRRRQGSAKRVFPIPDRLPKKDLAALRGNLLTALLRSHFETHLGRLRDPPPHEMRVLK